MRIKPESIIEAFQQSENFPCGSRPVGFYVKLGFSEKDIRESFGMGSVPVSYGNYNYLIGLTKDGSKEYVTIIPKETIQTSFWANKIGRGLSKQKRV